MMPIWAAVWKKALSSGRKGRRSGNSLPVHRETARQNTGLTTDSQTSGEKESARLWTDGRYFIAAAQQLEGMEVALQVVDGEGAVHPVELTESTIQANSRLFDRVEDVPTRAITMGIGTILKARRILLIAGADKREIVEKALTGPITPWVPASVLQLHRDVTVITCGE